MERVELIVAVYHQMGHHSENLAKELKNYKGAILSPLNADLERMRALSDVMDDKFELVFDPQLYFPATERAALKSWRYFPSDVETADVADLTWWSSVSGSILTTCDNLGAGAACSPIVVPNTFDLAFYRTSVDIADDMAQQASDIEVIQTTVVRLPELSSLRRVMEIASIIASTSVERAYLVTLVDEPPRRELTDSVALAGVLRLVAELESAGVSVIVGFTGPEALLYMSVGASACATGKFFNLRRFTPGRFDEPTSGGGQIPYWFEEALLAYLREADLVRVRAAGAMSAASDSNPYGEQVTSQLTTNPGAAWLALSWLQYMYWFADVDQRVRSGAVVVEDLLVEAEETWQQIEDSRVLMEEPRNDGRWVRPWRIALGQYSESW